MSRNVVKKLILVFVIILIFALFFIKSYFSEATESLILTRSKIVSSKYLESVIATEIANNDTKLFYQNVSSDGVSHASFDINKANSIVNNVMKKMRKISEDFNEECTFEIEVPINYLFMSSSYFLSKVTLNVLCSSLLSYDVNLVSDVKEYGINSSLVSLNLKIDINYQDVKLIRLAIKF